MQNETEKKQSIGAWDKSTKTSKTYISFTIEGKLYTMWKNDYKVNLKSELEVRMLHEKVDFILHHQGEHLHELQSQILELNQLLVKQIVK